MAKSKVSKKIETGFGEVGLHQLQGPYSFQDGHSTPEHLCDSLPEYDGKPMDKVKLPRDPAGFVPCGLFGEKDG